MEIGYFSSNGTFLYATKFTKIGEETFGWINLTVIATPQKDANFTALMFVFNGSGTLFIRNFTATPVNASSLSVNSTFIARYLSLTDILLELKPKKYLIVNESDLVALIILNGEEYHPGDEIRADFYIMNKVGIVDEVDIKLEVYYHGIKVYSYSHPSWREYSAGKIVHIFQSSRLPRITPPGKYTLKFYITPKGREPKVATTTIVVKPTLSWFAMVFVAISFMLLLGIVLVKAPKFIEPAVLGLKKAYKEFSVGQKFVFYAIVGLILSAIVLALGAENYANDIAIGVYYLLLIGVINLWIEYFEPKWDNPNIRTIASFYLLALLLYLSRVQLTIYPSMISLGIGISLSVLYLRSRPKRKLRVIYVSRKDGELFMIAEDEEWKYMAISSGDSFMLVGKRREGK
ncbi:hypothetical protein [Thermococcus chitonophagus]|uniref:hypothetical protein n=1 Tax=Thermococcus chitonophagus TaxID=54262 RepID=UPI0012EDBED8|nr:hypothetical protein [Thermococcus chitonophagus]